MVSRLAESFQVLALGIISLHSRGTRERIRTRPLRSKVFGSEGVRMASRRSLLRCLEWTGCVILGAILVLVLSAAQACNKTNQASTEMVLTIIDQSWLDKPSQALLSEELKQFTQETGIRVQVLPPHRSGTRAAGHMAPRAGKRS